MKPDIVTDAHVHDRGEKTSRIEPLLLGVEAKTRPMLTDLALELAQKSASFRSSLPAAMVPPLATLVRAMNCYYSNLIEGHNTHPIDIERALKNDFSLQPKQRNLQLEAKAHIEVQQWIDQGGLAGHHASSVAGICEIHRRFCAMLPEELLWVEDPETRERVRLVPGEFRQRDVAVGNHVAVSPGAVPRFMARFERAYSDTGRTESILAVASAHHRLLWLHPFLDGNGRVARLMSHAMLLEALDTGAVWSVARGLARRVEEYKKLLSLCDRDRRNDLDGRGHLSEEALANFIEFFLQVSIDQVTFMEGLAQPATLRTRIQLWAKEEIRLGRLPLKADLILSAVLYQGELARGDSERVVQTGERQARRIVASLLERGVLASAGSRSPLTLAFPAAVAHRWMPGLFPEQIRTE